MLNRKILLATSCAIALLVGCKSGGNDSTGNKLPYGPASSNITITKENLPAEAKVCSDDDTFDGFFWRHDDFAQTISITNNGYISVSINTSATGKKEDCIVKPFILSNSFHNLYVNYCSTATNTKDEGQVNFISDTDSSKFLILGSCAGKEEGEGDIDHIDIDYILYNNGSNVRDIIAEQKDLISEDLDNISVDSSLLQFSVVADKGHLHMYDLNNRILSSAFINLETGGLIEDYQLENGLLISENSIELIYGNDMNEYVCYGFINSCSKLGVSYTDDINIIMSNNGSYIYYNQSNSNDVNLITLPNKQKTEKLFSLQDHAILYSTTNDGTIIISNSKENDDSNYYDIYSYKNKKLVDMLDIIKAVHLEKILSANGKFYGEFQLSPNGKFLAVFSGKDKEWNTEDNAKLKEIDRIYLPQGIDELVKTLPAKQL